MTTATNGHKSIPPIFAMLVLLSTAVLLYFFMWVTVYEVTETAMRVPFIFIVFSAILLNAFTLFPVLYSVRFAPNILIIYMMFVAFVNLIAYIMFLTVSLEYGKEGPRIQLWLKIFGSIGIALSGFILAYMFAKIYFDKLPGCKPIINWK
jgi:hypothetical protein